MLSDFQTHPFPQMDITVMSLGFGFVLLLFGIAGGLKIKMSPAATMMSHLCNMTIMQVYNYLSTRHFTSTNRQVITWEDKLARRKLQLTHMQLYPHMLLIDPCPLFIAPFTALAAHALQHKVT